MPTIQEQLIALQNKKDTLLPQWREQIALCNAKYPPAQPVKKSRCITVNPYCNTTDPSEKVWRDANNAMYSKVNTIIVEINKIKKQLK